MRYMIVPGRVESVCIIADLKGLSLSQVQYASLMEIKPVLVNQHAGRVFRFYVCNMPILVRSLSGLVQSLMTERQRQKMVFVRDPALMRKDFALHQLEEDLGGSRQLATEFLPFPLPPGPFEAGSSAEPYADAVANCHEVLTDSGARGHLWDPCLSHSENCRLEFATTSQAVGLLKEIGVSPTDASTTKSTSMAWTACAEGRIPAAEERQQVPSVFFEERGPLVEDAQEIAPAGLFSCTCRVHRC